MEGRPAHPRRQPWTYYSLKNKYMNYIYALCWAIKLPTPSLYLIMLQLSIRIKLHHFHIVFYGEDRLRILCIKVSLSCATIIMVLHSSWCNSLYSNMQIKVPIWIWKQTLYIQIWIMQTWWPCMKGCFQSCQVMLFSCPSICEDLWGRLFSTLSANTYFDTIYWTFPAPISLPHLRIFSYEVN